MFRVSHAVSLLLLASAQCALAQNVAKPDEPGKLNLPPTSLERLENNPAKAAVIAREEQKKAENAEKGKLAEDAAGGDVAAGIAATRLKRSIEDALRKDPRTAGLGVTTRVAADGAITLRGKVPSQQSRTTVESVVTKAAGSARIQNELEITAR